MSEAGRMPIQSVVRQGDRPPTGASLAAILLVIVAVGAVTILHVVRGEIHPVSRVMSEYANGSHGRLMTITFYAFGLSSIALGFRLSYAIARHLTTRLVTALLVLGGVGLLAAGIFEVERAFVPDTIEEVIHSYATMAAFVMIVTSMLLFSYACKTDKRWWDFRTVSTTLALFAATAAILSPFSADSGWSGAVQRVLGASVLCWFLATALHVRTRAFRSG